MSKRERRDSERHETQPDEEQHRPAAEGERTERQEGDSVVALKAILAKVSALLKPLQLTQEECTKLVEDLYSSVLAMDLQLAGETDDTRKSSVLAHIENTQVTRQQDGHIAVQFPTAADAPAASGTDGKASGRPADTPAQHQDEATSTAADEKAS